MTPVMRTSSMWLAALGCAVGLATAAPKPVDETAPPLERLQHRLLKVRGLIQNARIKFEHGVADGVQRKRAATLEAPAPPTTPGQSCCSGNLERLWRHLAGMNKDAAELKACYEGEARSLALNRLGLVTEDLALVRRTVGEFERATKPPMTAGFLAGMQRTYLQLERDMAPLPPCPRSVDQ